MAPNLSKPIVLIGGGGHAKVLIDTLLLINRKILGILDSDKKLHHSRVLEIPVLGGDEKLSSFPPSDVVLVNGIGSTQNTEVRRKIFEKLSGEGYTFENVIHPQCIIASSVRLGEGCQILAGAIVQPGVILGKNIIVNTGAQIDHDCIIEDHCHLGPGALLSGSVTVGYGSHLGTGAIAIQGVKIGSSVLVAAGAVVTKNVIDKKRVMGVPAKEF